mmetsp:Transcript_11161/g.20284  ORF Transcript_11161/g.20284 Transcript_11161/m.20284 type:complete len:308 (+) Transcript_11161:58-981(+)
MAPAAKQEVVATKQVQNAEATSAAKTLLPEGHTAPVIVKKKTEGVSWSALMRFLFPLNLEHPESTGRLELFARYGPVDEEGRLHGGIGGSHVHTDLEIHQMIIEQCRERLFELVTKPRDVSEVVVEQLLPIAMTYQYTEAEVQKLLKKVPRDRSQRMEFAAMQDAILAEQTRRLQAVVAGGPGKKERGIRVPFQSEPQHILMAVTRRKKRNHLEERVNMEKRLGSYTTLLAGLEDNNRTDQIVANVTLCRRPGDIDDRWDRYCAIRRVGKSSYVKARNQDRADMVLDDGLSSKHAGASSLLATSMHR